MKFLILLGDGMADRPLEQLRGKTPLQAAYTPNMDALANAGRSGLAKTVPTGMPPGSDVANLSAMGYDPQLYYTGRAPLEAAAMEIPICGDDVAFRCNFVCVEDDVMVDYSAGHISSDEGKKLVKALKPVIPGERIYSGVSYRNILVLSGGEKAVCTPPHDITDKRIGPYLPSGEGSSEIMDIMQRTKAILATHPVNLSRINEGKRPANMIWLWGQGKAPQMPLFQDRYGLKGAVISAVDLLKGMGRYAGMQVIDVPGATGTIDTNYSGKVDAALKAFSNVDLVYLHVEAPDEAAHEGDLQQKMKAIELFDSNVVGPMIGGLKDLNCDWRAAVLPDHPTPISLKTHSSEPVPFAIAGNEILPDEVTSFSEDSASNGGFGVIKGTEVMDILTKRL